MSLFINRALGSRALLTKVHKIQTPVNHARCITLKPEKVKEQTDDFVEHNTKLGRPMSPHITIYAFPLPATLSICHRMTGVTLAGYATVLGMGALILPHDFSYYVSAIEGLQLSGATLAITKFILAYPFAFHGSNGLRHLFWDTGKFLSMKEVYATGYAQLAASVILAGILATL